MQAADESLPCVVVGQELAAHFHEDRVVGEPEVRRRSGQDVVFLVDLAGQRLRFGAGLHHGGGLGAAGFAEQDDGGQLSQFGILLLLRYGQTCFGFTEQLVHVRYFGWSFGRRGATCRGFRLFVASGRDPRHYRRDHDANYQDDGLHHERVGIFQERDLLGIGTEPGDRNPGRRQDGTDDDVVLLIHRYPLDFGVRGRGADFMSARPQDDLESDE